MIVRETRPTLEKSAGSNSGTETPGLIEALEFTVSANSGEDVIWEQVIFEMTSTDNGGSAWNTCGGDMANSDFSLYDSDDMGDELEDADIDWTLLDSNIDGCAGADVLKYAVLRLPTPEVISAGTTNTYVLEFDATGASSADDDTLRFDIQDDPLVSVGNFVESDADELQEALDQTETEIDVANAASFIEGDIVCIDDDDDSSCESDEELVLVQDIDFVGDVLTVYRGYLGTDQLGVGAIDDAMHYCPSSFTWDDDGSTTAVNDIGSYLVDELPVKGNTLQF
jgi:hypothetical protein